MGGVTYAHGLEEVLGLLVDVEHAALAVLGEVESRDLGDVLVLALTLLLLKLEGDTADGTTLDTLHQMGGVTSNLFHTHTISNMFSVEISSVEEVSEPCCEDAWRQ